MGLARTRCYDHHHEKAGGNWVFGDGNNGFLGEDINMTYFEILSFQFFIRRFWNYDQGSPNVASQKYCCLETIRIRIVFSTTSYYILDSNSIINLAFDMALTINSRWDCDQHGCWGEVVTLKNIEESNSLVIAEMPINTLMKCGKRYDSPTDNGELVAPTALESPNMSLEDESSTTTENAKRTTPREAGCRFEGFVRLKKVLGKYDCVIELMKKGDVASYVPHPFGLEFLMGVMSKLRWMKAGYKITICRSSCFQEGCFIPSPPIDGPISSAFNRRPFHLQSTTLLGSRFSVSLSGGSDWCMRQRGWRFRAPGIALQE
ncbi:hypothetical protein L1987_42866 [Smallanthus sonchifolius]|uniref:Uncharacterized protein n=1 Tax=Smallanthus sonchifolius TaxID=185202 RepID=A0ACB9GJZ6_9ASTR|nr:hypothetical protein L1987_42866 [Smallanthus sonchifolius]